MERAVVTGASGFIGGHVVAALLARGTRVTGIDLRPPGGVPGSPDTPGRTGGGGYSFVSGDIASDDVLEHVRHADAVIHLAGRAGVRPSWGGGFGVYLRDNVLATQRLLEACVLGRVCRFVYASSSSVYGTAGTPVPESAVPNPVSPYGASKLAGEGLCSAYGCLPGSGTGVVVLRYFTVYGPGQRPDMAISRLIGSALTGREFNLLGDGKQERDFTYVSDIVDATLRAAALDLRDGSCLPEVFNVGTGVRTRMRDLIGLVEESTGRRIRLRSSPPAAGDMGSTCADTRRAAAVLGHRSAVPLRLGITRQLSAMRGSR
ncbi:epimerase [Streptomyces carminius]|uniref:Epimerase n=1 Tax=Streptomyces carminius TaxID=2665496 RepID=A0A2M8LX76_9ACTN|nr:epimerase [Streptomyces carminius]